VSTAYIRSLMAVVEAEHANQAQREEQARAEAQAAREKLVPLDVRLKRLLDTIPPEVQTDGISLETLRKMVRGVKGRGCHCGAIGDELRKLGWRRVRSWMKSENGFRAFRFPLS
jgi:hypothetical protein